MNRPAPTRRHDEDREPFDEPGLDIEVLRRRREVALTVVALLLILSVSIFAAVRLLWVPKPAREDLTAVAQRAVRAALPPGLVPYFNTPGEAILTEKPDGRHQVEGTVLALTQTGQTYGYYSFTCTVAFTDRAWRPAKLELIRLQ